MNGPWMKKEGGACLWKYYFSLHENPKRKKKNLSFLEKIVSNDRKWIERSKCRGITEAYKCKDSWVKKWMNACLFVCVFKVGCDDDNTFRWKLFLQQTLSEEHCCWGKVGMFNIILLLCPPFSFHHFKQWRCNKTLLLLRFFIWKFSVGWLQLETERVL